MMTWMQWMISYVMDSVFVLVYVIVPFVLESLIQRMVVLYTLHHPNHLTVVLDSHWSNDANFVVYLDLIVDSIVIIVTIVILHPQPIGIIHDDHRRLIDNDHDQVVDQ